LLGPICGLLLVILDPTTLGQYLGLQQSESA